MSKNLASNAARGRKSLQDTAINIQEAAAVGKANRETTPALLLLFDLAKSSVAAQSIFTNVEVDFENLWPTSTSQV